MTSYNLESKTIDLVVPLYNEEAVIEAFHRSLLQAIEGLPYRFQNLLYR